MTKSGEITAIQLYEKLKQAWSLETSSKWQPDNPARGQCSVTAIAVHDILGGDILKTRTPGGTHFYNRLNDIKWDLTVSQFDQPVPYEDLPSSREEALADTSPDLYAALIRRLDL
ncbi:MAG TPA: hypothetical protein VGV39_26615 [Mesorhizobium sp.]|jgi:hypothetical protein|uniref:YunG family protein n=1 Tax=Mesorhizobium sp. TaxID=1871066 RepID=UPI002DDCEFB5|nr:hypothetical protein [Mesorhizobium sp.]HEV2506676.1 hypothetical protein [Mesorhizobium sp.]